MRFSARTVTSWLLTLGSAAAFSKTAFSPSRNVVTKVSTSVSNAHFHRTGCACPQCVSGQRPSSSNHVAGCDCAGCTSRGNTMLFMADVSEGEAPPVADVDEGVPPEVVAMDGIESEEEAHNAERPARAQIKKKRPPKGKPVTEFEPGSMVSGTVVSVASYGAFVDVGAASDGLLHISQLATGFVADVNEVVKVGDKIEVRIVSIDADKGQLALSLLSEDEAQAPQERPQRRKGGGGRGRREAEAAVINALVDKGWDTDAFVEGTVARILDFGCFVRLDASTFNSEVEGELDGLVHISSMATNRVSSVDSLVSVDDKIQVRMKSIDGDKVALSMITAEEEGSKGGPRGSSNSKREVEGAADWKESLAMIQAEMPEFINEPTAIVDRRAKV